MRGNPDWSEYPVSVELRFPSEGDKRKFMAGLSDGFGESACQLDWPWAEARRTPTGAVIGFHDQGRFAVDVFAEVRGDEEE